MKSILSPCDLIDFGEYRDTSPVLNLSNVIADVEKMLFRSVLGKEFYDLLKPKVSDTSSAVKWLSTTAFLVGEYAILDKRIYVALIANTNKRPDANPAEWKIAERFTDACLNELWCNGSLARIIALQTAIYQTASSLSWRTYGTLAAPIVPDTLPVSSEFIAIDNITLNTLYRIALANFKDAINDIKEGTPCHPIVSKCLLYDNTEGGKDESLCGCNTKQEIDLSDSSFY